MFVNLCYIVFATWEWQERSMMMENGMTNNQFIGIIKMIIALIENDTPKEKLLEYLKELIS